MLKGLLERTRTDVVASVPLEGTEMMKEVPYTRYHHWHERLAERRLEALADLRLNINEL